MVGNPVPSPYVPR